MIRWQDEAILLSTRRHGESAAIIELLTPNHGRALGVVRGGGGRRMAPILQPGAQLAAHWSARIEEHLGHFTVEPVRSRAVQAMSSRLALAGISAVAALLGFVLPERDPYPALYKRTQNLLDLLGQDDIWPLAYLRWEQALLDDLGFGLDLAICAVTGARENLAFVSPKTGRAVSAAGAGDWASRLLPLPPVLKGQSPTKDSEIHQALDVTGYFLTHHVAPSLGTRPLPESRARFIETL